MAAIYDRRVTGYIVSLVKEYLSYTLAINVETLELPVTRLDGIHTAVSDDIVELLHHGYHVKGIHTSRLLQRLIDRLLHLGVEHFEQILEQQRDEIARHLNTLVSIVILHIIRACHAHLI